MQQYLPSQGPSNGLFANPLVKSHFESALKVLCPPMGHGQKQQPNNRRPRTHFFSWNNSLNLCYLRFINHYYLLVHNITDVDMSDI